MNQDAVIVKYAFKRYGKGQSPVFDGLNMTVPRGCIYGLLGASGCGKTTLLSCIVGVRKLDQGEVWVLGGKPGQKNSGIPGPRVGYMPQEISLVGEFSVIGALYYFGRINGLEDSDIEKRFTFFSKLLQLPPNNRLVKNLSGGQQRRVSFAASLIHKPELLILDEPTVGLDPILRENIWQFLVKLTKEEGTSVIMTTHYIEEAKLANRVGILRCGQLLAETTPIKLLAKLKCQSLQDAFLILSQRQQEYRDKGSSAVGDNRFTKIDFEEVSTNDPSSSQSDLSNNITMCTINNEEHLANNQCNERKKSASTSFGKIFRALMIKNLLQILRHPGIFVIAFIFPMLQTTIFFNAIGGDPKGIVIAVVNDEAKHCNHGRNLGQVIYNSDEGTCDYIDISCRFLHGFNESIMMKRYYKTLEEATLAVQANKATGSMYFGRNFSQALQKRRDSASSFTDDDIFAGEIHTTLDRSDFHIGIFLQKNLYEQFFNIHADIVSTCNISRKFVNLPIYFEEPVFGRKDQKYSESTAPGFMLTGVVLPLLPSKAIDSMENGMAVTYFLATALTSSIIIDDRTEGVWHRSLVQGVTTSAILFSHILTQFVIMTIQVNMILLIAFVCFQLPCRGNFGMVLALSLLTGFGGMCYGFLVSVLCTSYTLAHLMAIGFFYSLVLLGGVIWPIEGSPLFLRYIGYSMPTTIPSFSLRGLVDKDLPISDPEVYNGFLVTIGWIAILVTLCLIVVRKN